MYPVISNAEGFQDNSDGKKRDAHYRYLAEVEGEGVFGYAFVVFSVVGQGYIYPIFIISAKYDDSLIHSCWGLKLPSFSIDTTPSLFPVQAA